METEGSLSRSQVPATDSMTLSNWKIAIK